MNPNTTERQVIVPITRLPENIGRVLNMYLSGDVTTLHICAITRDGKILNTGAGDLPSVLRENDSLK